MNTPKEETKTIEEWMEYFKEKGYEQLGFRKKK